MTDTALNTIPSDRDSLASRARDAASTAHEAVSSAALATVGAAREHPYPAAGIAVGVAAAVGGAAYAVTRSSSSH